MKLRIRETTHELPAHPLVMGIVNLGADSFSGDGTPEVDAALARARQHLEDGAEIIDVGAESARTNRAPVSPEEEVQMLRRFLERWPGLKGEFAGSGREPWLSINTWRPEVVREVLPFGGDILNDIGALPTDENAQLCAASGAALLIMHSIGQPKVPHTHVGYDDVMARIEEFFAEKLAMCSAAGLHEHATILDPGIDFAKQREDNLRIYRELSRLTKFNRPILLPVSRKTVIGDVLGIRNPAERDAGTVACIVQGIERGANILRVHSVRAAVQTVRIISALR